MATTVVELPGDLAETLAFIGRTVSSALRFKDTWLRCPQCGQEEEFSFCAPARKYIRQYPSSRERSEAPLTFLDYPDEDFVACERCDYYGPYAEFETTS
jgi:hypothetical protein